MKCRQPVRVWYAMILWLSTACLYGQPPDADEAKNALRAGATLASQPDGKGPDAKRPEQELNRALELFERASQLGTDADKAKARNNAGSLYLKLGKPQQALEKFLGCSEDSIPKEQRYVWRYNLGRAYAELGQPAKSYEQFQASVRDNPQFTPAMTEAWRQAWQLPDSRRGNALFAAATAMVDSGQAQLLRETCYRFAERTDAGPQIETLVTLTVLALAHLPITPEDFTKSEAQQLTAAKYPPRAIREIQRAYVDRLTIEETSLEGGAVRQFPWWSAAARPQYAKTCFAQLLVHLGKYYDRRGLFAGREIRNGGNRESRQAFTRYLLAWMVDVENWDAAADAAAVLAANPRGLASDPEGANLLIKRQDQLIDALFQEKGGLIVKRGKTAQDWKSLLRLHVMLGMIFESRGQWGSESIAHSAIFQYNSAIKVEEQIRQMDNGFRAAGLHSRLGHALKSAGRDADAFQHYVMAAETHLERKEVTQASSLVEKARELNFSRDAQQELRIRTLPKQIEGKSLELKREDIFK